MSGFTPITKFGSLTVNGQKLQFKDFDKDGNGEISENEYNEVLKAVKLDKVEFSNFDNNNDKTISQKEFTIWEQKILMQDAVNGLAGQISIDFSGKLEVLEEVTEELKNLIDDYSKTFRADISTMAESFSKELPEKYQAIKNRVLANDPSTISANVLYEIATQLAYENYAGKPLSGSAISRIMTELSYESTRFLQTYNGNSLEKDLTNHLLGFLNTSDAVIMNNAANTFRNNINQLGQDPEFQKVKEEVTKLLEVALEKGVTLKLGGLNILTPAAIQTALSKYTDAAMLINSVNNVLSKLSSKSRKEVFIEDVIYQEELAEDTAFSKINGSEYVIDPKQIDFAQVDSRYSSNANIYERGVGWDGSKAKAYEEGYKVLSSENLKKQLKAQIETMLQQKGFSFDKIASLFENVYSQSIQETLNSDGMITGRDAKWFERRGKAYINVKDLCDKFITIFNKNISVAVDVKNASSKDFDTSDLDFNKLGNGVSTVNGDNFAESYRSGIPLVTFGKGQDYYVKIAEQILEGLKSQMKTKAEAMSRANGVKFDETKFNEIFYSNKKGAVEISAGGKDKVASTTAAGIAGSVVAAAGSTVAGFFIGGAVVGSMTAGIGSLIGALVGGIVGLSILGGGSAFSILKGDRAALESSILDTKTLVDTFTENFKKDYTTLIENEKTKETY